MAVKQQAGILSPLLPAGGRIPFAVLGRYFHLVDSPCSIGVKLDEGSESLMRPGSGVELMGGDEFRRIELHNPSNAPVRVSFWAGFSRYYDYRLALIEPETELHAWNGTSIAANNHVDFHPQITGTRIRRKCIMITNGDPNLRLQVRDQAGNVALQIMGQDSITLPISGFVRVHNPNGSPVDCSISEIYWTQ
jgi:hypothetical protein